MIVNLSNRLRNDLVQSDYLLFRGLCNTNFQLVPTIGRYPSLNTHNSLLWFENRLVEEAQRKVPDIFTEEDYPINLLTKLQHFGIPTRLLDVTSNGLVALYFACQTDKSIPEDVNGEVIVFIVERDEVHSNTSPIANAISLSYKLSRNTFFNLDDLLQIAENDNFFNSFKQRNGETRHKYLTDIKSRFEHPLFIFPLELSERQKRQQGAFILFPNEMSNKKDKGIVMHDMIKPIEKNEKYVQKRIIIRKENKKEILKHLSYLGITEDYLFGDSIDTVCQSIKKNIENAYH